MASNRAQLRLRIYLDGREPIEVATRLADHNHWDITRARHKWPSTQDAPITWLGFMAWAAARRIGAVDMPWEQFLEECDGVENLDNDEEGEDEDVRPTLSALGPDLSVNSP